MRFIAHYLVLFVNPMGRILVRWKSFRNHLEMLCHPIYNRLYLCCTISKRVKWLSFRDSASRDYNLEMCFAKRDLHIAKRDLHIEIISRCCATLSAIGCICDHLSVTHTTKETYILQKETDLLWKETYILQKETYILQKETCILQKETDLLRKETYIWPKETHVSRNESRFTLLCILN